MAPTQPLLSGTYTLSVTRCALPGESGSGTAMTVVEPDQNIWTLAQSGGQLTGQTTGSVPPFTWSGTLAATVNAASIQITSLQYTDGSTHSELQTLTASGQAGAGSTGITGTLTGDYSSAFTIGSVAGPTSSCHGAQMPFRFAPAK